MTPVVVAAATVLAACVQSATGFGFALVLGPALFAALDPAKALTTLLVLGTALNLLVLVGERRPLRIRWRELGVVLLAAAPGVVAGALILRVLAKPDLEVVVGIAVVGASLLAARARRASEASPERRVRPGLAGSVGVLAGALTTTTGTSGPPLVLWLQHLGWGAAEVRDALATAFLALSLLGGLSLLALAQGQAWDLDPIGLTGLLLLTAGGHAAGRRLFARLGSARFRSLGLALVICAGAASIAAGVAG